MNEVAIMKAVLL